MAIKSLYHLDPLSTYFLCQYPTHYFIHSTYSHWVWHRHIQENMVSSLEKLNLVKETGIWTAIFILLLGNYKGTILDAWATCCGNKHSSSVSWERFHVTDVTLSWALTWKTNPWQKNYDRENCTLRSTYKELYLPPPPKKRLKDMNKQYTEKKKWATVGNRKIHNVLK